MSNKRFDGQIALSREPLRVLDVPRQSEWQQKARKWRWLTGRLSIATALNRKLKVPEGRPSRLVWTWKPMPVRVNCVSPGAIDNGQRAIPRNANPLSAQEQEWMQGIYTQSLRDTPMNRLGQMEEIAAAICFFAAPEASYITGQVLFVAGGGIG